jgi:hypothetical protein
MEGHDGICVVGPGGERYYEVRPQLSPPQGAGNSSVR